MKFNGDVVKRTKIVEVNGQTCTVQTLREWLEWRIPACIEAGRGESATELQIILEKINDNRIQEIQ